MLKRLWFLIYLFHYSVLAALFTRNKYMVNVENGYLCPDNDQLEVPMKKFSVDQLNRTHRAFNLDFTFANPLDGTAEGTLLTEKWNGGKWVNVPVVPYFKDPCNTAMKLGPPGLVKEWVNMERAMGMKNPGKCPIAPGNYSLKNYVINTVYDVPFWNGRFKCTAIFRRIDTKKKILCFIATVTFSEFVQ